jgi:HKD family nuclease
MKISTIFSSRMLSNGNVMIRLRNGESIFKHGHYFNAIAGSNNLSTSELLKPGREVMYDTETTKAGSDYCDEDGTVLGQLSKDKTEYTLEFSLGLVETQVEEPI